MLTECFNPATAEKVIRPELRLAIGKFMVPPGWHGNSTG